MNLCCGNGLQRNAIEREECRIIKEVIERHGNNLTHAAAELGISLSTMKRKALRHGLREKGKPLPGHRGGHPNRKQDEPAVQVEPS